MPQTRQGLRVQEKESNYCAEKRRQRRERNHGGCTGGPGASLDSAGIAQEEKSRSSDEESEKRGRNGFK